MSSPRVRKIADRIKVIVAEMLERRIKDPRLGFVTVTDVRVSGDTQQATIFYTVLGEDEDLDGTAAALDSAKGLIRSEVGKQLGMRHVPTLDFIHDALPETARHIDDLLERVRESDAAAAQSASGATYAGEADPYKKPRPSEADERVSAAVVSGLVVVDKPGGMTSHDVVARVRRLAGTRKVGHAGTLDPMATGVLVLGVDRATRLLGHLLLTDKAYDATIRLGATTTTDDAEGEVVRDRADRATSPSADVREALAGFVGEIEQVPSAVSAIKVDGRRAYDRVRAGEQVELAGRGPCASRRSSVRAVRDADVDVSVRCSSGTYVRAIARDLGERLGVGRSPGLRCVVPPSARSPSTSRARSSSSEDELVVLPIGDAARRAFPSLDLDEEQATDVGFGRALALDLGHDGPVALFAPRRRLPRALRPGG